MLQPAKMPIQVRMEWFHLSCMEPSTSSRFQLGSFLDPSRPPPAPVATPAIGHSAFGPQPRNNAVRNRRPAGGFALSNHPMLAPSLGPLASRHTHSLPSSTNSGPFLLQNKCMLVCSIHAQFICSFNKGLRGGTEMADKIECCSKVAPFGDTREDSCAEYMHKTRR